MKAQSNYTTLVNPFVGTGGHGHTFPGAVVPFGMVQVSPDTRIDGSWDGCSGYHYSDSIIYGFSHTHLSGTGVSDFGDILLMPTKVDKPSFTHKDYASKFTHADEVAKPGFYSVNLTQKGINVALTASTRAAFHQYTFSKNGTHQIVLDLLHRDKLLDGKINVINNKTISGYRRSEAWAKDQYVYFYIEFSKEFISKTDNGKDRKNATISYFTFNTKKGEKLSVKVGISLVDEEGAKRNLLTEIPHWDFNKTKQEAEDLWQKELSKIKVKGGTKTEREIFYTALYHCFIHPSTASDIDGRYRGRDHKIYQDTSFTYYSVFSLWDTFRALHPLFNLVQPERNVDFIKTFLAQYKQVGRMPMWELASNETDCMIGYHSVSIIADALAKGNHNFDKKLALEASLGTAKNHKYGAETFHKKGYLTVEDESESLSKSLEYAYNIWCLDQIKKHVGELPNKHQSFPVWQQVYNPETGFMQPRKNGAWYEPFDPREVNNNYTEANAWQYTFFVPQDILGLIYAMGGKAAFESKLDSLFNADTKTTGRTQADITGLIGQYAHGNEPSHHMAYLYNYVGKPEKTKMRVKQILKDMYQNAPDGLSGNEDCGQMSAWYVLSALGYYPVTPGLNEYQIGYSIFEDFSLADSTQNNAIRKNAYIGLNPKSAADYVSGTLLPSPIIIANSNTFTDSLRIEMKPNFKNVKADIYYSIKYNDSISEEKYQLYTNAFYLKSSAEIHAISSINWQGEMKNLESSAKFYKRSNSWEISLQQKYNRQYTAGGPEGLIDGIYGHTDWRKGSWQGYQNCDFEAIVDLKKVSEINYVFANFLQDQRSWIMMPKRVLFWGSEDGKNYTLLTEIGHQTPEETQENIIVKLEQKLTKPSKVRYLKIKAENFGKLPAWHISAGEEAFIFVDEVGVR
ncbi:MAG: GH92 family glycosyl hydrolase [Bacteroidia bacterium]|nr:GH92 family glycosyl hydrolase [Bacteroidia bacterium]